MTSRRFPAMNHHTQRIKGFSLIELMVALAAGLIVLSAVVAFLMSSFKGNSDFVQSTRLTQELRNTMDLITRDLRRAGYDDNAMAYLATGGISPFSRIMTCNAADVCTSGAAAPRTCIIYAYDRAAGTPGTIDVSGGEVRGIRLKTRSVNGRNVGVIEYAVSSGAIRPACAAAGPDYSVYPTTCNAATTWCPLSDGTKLDISTFTLTDTGANTGGVKLRDIGIVLQGRIAGTTDYVRGMKSSVRIRSDCYDTSLTNCILSP